MKKALIVTSYIEHAEDLRLQKSDYDLIICVDGGISFCKTLNINPNIVIGDWDSLKNPLPDDIIKISLDTEKDYTDADAAVNYAIAQGCENITVLGGVGGRLDHTIGAISLLTKKYVKDDIGIKLLDGKNLAFMLKPGKHFIAHRGYKYLGLFSYSESCQNLSVQGVKYPLEQFNLTNNTSLGVSNQIEGEKATISFEKGTLLVVQSNE